MTRAAVFAIAVALATAATAATAATSHAGHCHETSPVLGRRHCGGFGERWAISDALRFSYGLTGMSFVVDHFDVPRVDRTDAVFAASGASASARTRLAGSARGMTAYGFRDGLYLRGDVITLGLEMMAGDGASPPLVTNVDDRAVESQHGATVLELGGFASVRRRFDWLQLDAELFVGNRTLYLRPALPSGYNACPPTTTCPVVDTFDTTIVAPRMRISAWLGRRVTLGVTAGYDVIGGGESVALDLIVHLLAYDGT